MEPSFLIRHIFSWTERCIPGSLLSVCQTFLSNVVLAGFLNALGHLTSSHDWFSESAWSAEDKSSYPWRSQKVRNSSAIATRPHHRRPSFGAEAPDPMNLLGQLGSGCFRRLRNTGESLKNSNKHRQYFLMVTRCH